MARVVARDAGWSKMAWSVIMLRPCSVWMMSCLRVFGPISLEQPQGSWLALPAMLGRLLAALLPLRQHHCRFPRPRPRRHTHRRPRPRHHRRQYYPLLHPSPPRPPPDSHSHSNTAAARRRLRTLSVLCAWKQQSPSNHQTRFLMTGRPSPASTPKCC
ncbi:hypothetical protein DL89DRAFT_62718 [Linderina pennispora]|uniref:Uncharacterized protein n=1 Tax=Linderina pennispora TaxID=61395 RepID=A0A1Y1VRI2_9FUNG|nr:uncharacterized protein DL89DRAFT_62718 [Linderina pennispora]ORX63901.1 hypothetical protein DL89DRAFT_62718 [Linderina pennispora]